MAGADLGGVPVSPPGALSRRTDQPIRDIPAVEWGDAQEFRAIQSAAPMYAQPLPPKPADLFAPSDRPAEPITSGVDLGPGAGSDVLTGPAAMPVGMRRGSLSEILRRMAANDDSGDTARMLALAERLGW